MFNLLVILYRLNSLFLSKIIRLFFASCGENFRVETFNFRISGYDTIRIGDSVSLTHGCVLMGEGGIDIGNNVLIGPYTQFYSIDHGIKGKKPISILPTVKKPIFIEDDVWIGAGSIILKGVTIGKGAVIGAGSVVTKNIPPYSVYAGNPCRLIKKR